MVDKKGHLDRRGFLKAASAAGIASVLGVVGEHGKALAASPLQEVRVPTRPFGRSGVQVPILALGGMFDTPNNGLLLKQALRWGVAYWDTADCYGYGASEEGFGKFFQKQPQDREKIFLVTKSDDRDPEGMSRLLERSLKRLQTGYVDLYFVHGIRSIDEIDGRARKWAEAAKASGKIRLFGFSTHSNMESCMLGAARLGWIDGIMMSYNYRLMGSSKMKEAVAACAEAGIGLTAMKTQGGGQVSTKSPGETELAGRFLQKGFTEAQAKLKAVWEEPAVASICSQMPNMTLLMANVAAAVDQARLSLSDLRRMQALDRETVAHYCTGCTDLCEGALDNSVPIGDVMRCLMYSRSYGDLHLARELFAAISPADRNRLVTIDYSEAERRCPRKMSIGTLMKEAFEELA